ncbi:MAG TPA: hypothetical protein VF642_12220 [Propionibacteriaceae bacterium]|jgi:hypothetical protein
MIVIARPKPEPVTSTITVWLTASEKAEITRRARAAGMSVSAWARRRLTT